MAFFKRFALNNTGTTAIEYVLIASIISIAAVSALQAIGPKVISFYDSASDPFK